MHDGDEFFCLKHRFGRFVNSSESLIPKTNLVWRQKFQPLSVLLIAVPGTTHDRDKYPFLKQAEIELETVTKILTKEDLGIKLTVLAKREATFMRISQELTRNKYQVIHFCGHAQYDNEHPERSCLILYDQPMPTNSLERHLSMVRPLLCFINACDSARLGSEAITDITTGERRFSIHGLGRALLESGGFIIGNRWKVSDAVAGIFAEEFYRKVIAERVPLGEAIRASRLKCRKESPVDFGWASYIYYGDPRVRLRREDSPTPAASSS
jgi:CHAT domain-containing protein